MSLREDAIRIWRAGVDAVCADELVRRSIDISSDRLSIAGDIYDLPPPSRLLVVGAGKAGAGMAAGLERSLADWPDRDRRQGWVNIPEDCLRRTEWIHLHPARPVGFNAPTPEAVDGTARILDAVSQLTSEDLCLALISGGGSALLTAPIEGVSLADKLTVTRLLSEGGATIEELNCVRRALSCVKGGGLLDACRADRIAALVISDVVGDPIETIASGPLVPNPTTSEDAVRVLRKFAESGSTVPETVWRALDRPRSADADFGKSSTPHRTARHYVIGNNRTACEAAAAEAKRLGYDVIDIRPDEGGVARDVGRDLAREVRRVQQQLTPAERCCLITGGEPIVHLSPSERPRRGGRNQEVALAATLELESHAAAGVVILSGGTDGEDGPTVAAGAIADAAVIESARRGQWDARDHLARHDSYPFFAATGGLLKTGPTHTNVMDLRVALVEAVE